MFKNKTVIVVALVIVFIFYFITTWKQEYGLGKSSGIATVDLSVCNFEHLDNDRISLTVPKDYVLGASQKDLDLAAEESGYESITLNDNGSATYIMTAAQHNTLLTDLQGGIAQNIDTIPGSDAYKDITKIEYNSLLTDYKIYTSNKTPDYDSSMVVMNLKMYTTMYYAFDGDIDQTISFEFFNAYGESIATLETSTLSNN